MQERIKKTGHILPRPLHKEEAGGTAHFTDNRKNTEAQINLQQSLAQGVAQRAADPLRNAMQTSSRANAFFPQHKNPTGLPDKLKAGIEQLSGFAMDDVKVQYNSGKPAQLQAHAYAQGTHIHLAPGQQKQLPHEAWHVVQQKQGRVKPTLQLKNNVHINHDVRLEKEADVMGERAAAAGGSQNYTALHSGVQAAGHPVLQGRFYNGTHQYVSMDELKADLKDLLQIKETKEFSSSQPDILATVLWNEYGYSNAKHMEMEVVKKYAQRSKSNAAYTMLLAMKKYDPDTMNLPTNFPGRIKNDQRIHPPLREEYIKAWEEKRKEPNVYQKVKERVKKERKAHEMASAENVGHYLLLGKSAIVQDLAEVMPNLSQADQNVLIRIHQLSKPSKKILELLKDSGEKRNERLTNLDLSTQTSDFTGKNVSEVNTLCQNLEARVLAMKHDLYGAFYYNDKGNTMIETSDALSSFHTREKARIKKGEKEESFSNTSDSDVDEHTDDYVFMFIEHKDTPLNIRTRFVLDKDKQVPGAMRRRRRLNKLATIEGVTLQLDDLAKDTVGKKIIGDKKDKEKRLFRHGGNNDRLTGILKNLVAGVKHRLSLIDHSVRYNDVIASLEVLVDKGSDLQLWSYLVRYIIQPQFMVPQTISHAMKGQTVDGPVNKRDIKGLELRDNTEKKELKALGVKYFKQTYAPEVDEMEMIMDDVPEIKYSFDDDDDYVSDIFNNN